MSFKLKTFKYDNEAINGILHEADFKIRNNQKIFIIFLHGWLDYRTGPHRILVDIANDLSGKGFYCFRFDFRGRGFSDGNFKDTSYSTIISDIDTVIYEIKKEYNPHEIILLGICYGAKLAIYYALNGKHKINNVIELSSVPLFDATVQKDIYLFKNTRNLLKLFFSNNNVSKIRGRLKKEKISFELLYATIIRFWLKIVVIFLTDIPQMFLFKKKSKTKEHKGNYKGQILSIHGMSDNETEITMMQVKAICFKNKIPHTGFIIPDADKYFCSLHWKTRLIHIINSWLDDIYCQNSD